MMTARRADGAERMTLTALRAGGEFGNGAESECCRVKRMMAYMVLWVAVTPKEIITCATCAQFIQ